MAYVLGWFLIVALLALWSFGAWALHGVAQWTVSQAGALGGSAAGIGLPALPAWMTPWVPPELLKAAGELLAGVGPFLQNLLQAAPMLTGALNVATWVVWGIGCATLLLLGAGMHLLIAGWRGRTGGASLAAG